MDHIILEMPKRMDAASLPRMRKLVVEAFDGPTHLVVLNFENCGFIDSRGLSVIVTGLKLATQKGKTLRLVYVEEEIRLLLQITRFDRICDIHEDMESALS